MSRCERVHAAVLGHEPVLAFPLSRYAIPAHILPSVQVRRPVSGSNRVRVAPFAGQQGAIPKLKLTCLGVTVEINKTHYDKLRLLHARAAGSAAHDATAFTHAAMALLLRYSSLQGTHYRGGGFQARTTLFHAR